MQRRTAVIEIRVELDDFPGAWNKPEHWVNAIEMGHFWKTYKAKAKFLRMAGPLDQEEGETNE